MERFMSGTEVEKMMAAAGVSENLHPDLFEGELEAGRLWEADDYPEPAVVLGDPKSDTFDEDSGPRFGWAVFDVLGWMQDRGLPGSRESQAAISQTLWELGFQREAHSLILGPTGARKEPPPTLPGV